MMGRFQHFELRTTDTAVATNFYVGVYGPEFWGPGRAVSVLPERALALGARPHWVGHLGVGDPLAVAGRLLEQGAERLGPARTEPDGSACVLLRDPFGALLAVGAARDEPADAASWHVLHTSDLDAACAFYARLFGWHFFEEAPLPGMETFRHRAFAWEADGEPAGSVTNAATSVLVHRQWLHFFAVTEVERARERVTREGGYALDAVIAPSGDAFVAADDAQGAAFGLHRAAPR